MKRFLFISAFFMAVAISFAIASTDARTFWEQGVKACEAGDYSKAAELYQKADSAFSVEGIEPLPDPGSFYIDMGRIYYALGNMEATAECMEKAIDKVEKFGENYELILNFLGYYYDEKKDIANAYRILGLMDEHNQHELEKDCNDIDCHLDKAQYYSVTGNQAKAKEEYMAAFEMAENDALKARAYKQYSDYLYYEKDFTQAAQYLELALGLMKDSDINSEDFVRQLHSVAVYYFLGYDFEKAIDKYLEEIKLIEDYRLSDSMLYDSLRGLGNAYSGKKDYDSAVKTFSRLLKKLESGGHTDDELYAKTLESLASVEKFKGDYDNSIQHYENAITIYGNLGLYDQQETARAGLSTCLFYVGKTMDDTGNTGIGKDMAQSLKSDKIHEILKNSIDELKHGGMYLGKLSYAGSLVTIAGCYRMLKDFPNAAEYYRQYITALRDAVAEDFLLRTPRERELVWNRELINISELGELIFDIPQDTELYTDISNLIYESELLSKGILLSSNIEFEKVLKRYGTSKMMSDYDEIKENLARIDKMKSEEKPVEEILDLIRETESMQRALAGKSAEYADFMNYLRITSDDVLNSLNDDSAAIEFSEIGLGLEKLMVAVIVSKEFPRGKCIPLKLGSVLDDGILRMDLYTQEVLMNLQESMQRFYEEHNIAIDDSETNPVTESDAYAESQHYWSLQHIAEDENKYHDDGYGRQIWEDILSVIPDKRKIYFAPVGLLNNIAIENLQLNGRPISEQYELFRLSSTRELARERQERPLTMAALFGDIDYIGDGEEASDKSKYTVSRASDGLEFGNLENTRREVDEINAILSKKINKSFVYTGTKASRSEFLSQQQLPIGLLHIATHGKFFDADDSDSDAMRRSILAFAGANMFDGYEDNDGIVTAQDISEMSLYDCSLVVLSACESGLGQLGSDGVFGLQRGFKNAGVESLLVSLNEVADNATADMMIAFYENLFKDNAMSGKREALRAAQSVIREKYPDDDTWASFILIDALK